MNKAERESQIRAYFETCNSHPDNLEMVGIGNPSAKILIVGQESADMAIRRNIEDVSACLNKGDCRYINEDQIGDTFDVTKDSSSGRHTNQYSRSMWFDVYHSADGKRLVIHTRQLSQYSDELLEGMADVIKGHFRKREEEYRAEWYD